MRKFLLSILNFALVLPVVAQTKTKEATPKPGAKATAAKQKKKKKPPAPFRWVNPIPSKA